MTRDELLYNSVFEILSTIISIFVAITSVIGAILLISGAENANLGFSLLEGTPFTDFFIPGILLLLIVGTTSSIASFAFIKNINNKQYFSLVAGGVLTGWITIEMLVLNQPHPTTIEYTYLFIGILLVLFSVFLIAKQKKY